jgi:catechol 2,3-dioxygenase-like lactoylglutathione lyase family enzyme
MTPAVSMMFHPTLAVSDLERAREWFRAVFRCPDVRWEERYDLSLLNPGYPTNYSFFMMVADVLLDALCPSMHATGDLNEQRRYDPSRQRPIGLGWYTDDATGMAARLGTFGIKCHDQMGQRVIGERKPESAMAPDILICFTEPEGAGLRYEFFQLGERHRPFYSRRGDPRLRPGWSLPQVSPDDPLAIERASHHTILTVRPDRAIRLHVDVLGGSVIAKTWNSAMQSDSTYIRLAGSVFELAVPRGHSPYRAKLTGIEDVYYGITFKVADLDLARSHLESTGCHPHREADDAIVVEPTHGMGVQWRFVTTPPYHR